jgi:hypothetical protein
VETTETEWKRNIIILDYYSILSIKNICNIVEILNCLDRNNYQGVYKSLDIPEVSKNGLQFFLQFLKWYFWTISILAVAMPTSEVFTIMEDGQQTTTTNLGSARNLQHAFLDEKAIFSWPDWVGEFPEPDSPGIAQKIKFRHTVHDNPTYT